VQGVLFCWLAWRHELHTLSGRPKESMRGVLFLKSHVHTERGDISFDASSLSMSTAWVSLNVQVGGSGAAIFDWARAGPTFGADALSIGPPLSPVRHLTASAHQRHHGGGLSDTRSC